jgi:hypothetical protein
MLWNTFLGFSGDSFVMRARTYGFGRVEFCAVELIECNLSPDFKFMARRFFNRSS